MTAKEKIRAKALALGFSKVGFAEYVPHGEESARLAEWLVKGYHASMGWMERTQSKRSDPAEVLHDIQSIVSLALNYYTPHSHSENPETGKISRYAWGDDYHVIVGEMLAELSAWIEEEFPDAKGKWYVDTGPVMEKAWAQRAGIGWIGKHTNVITQEMGSWVFLGEVLTTLKLEGDAPATDHCGTCSLCIEACPTDAITQPYVVDSNRCISYLTIEHRGDFNQDLDFKGWIYGCDICQDVCPWNEKFSQRTGIQEFEPGTGAVAPLLKEWGKMTEDEFSLRFRKSAMRRTKREGLTRNIRYVSAQTRTRET